MGQLVQDVHLDTVRSALGPRFRVEREIGRGGAATVYLAQDSRYERPVAIKVLRPELAAAVARDRFFLEIKLTAQLSHPHILKLLESDEVDGVLYYIMPYVAGGSLRQRIRREKQLSFKEAIRITQEVADALTTAHAQGVVHRDIKPENILFEAGHAVVADFGIAKAITEAAGDRMTITGTGVGTPGYMSPEQATGQSNLDHRSDIYSLGCVVYEMLAGEPPYTGPTAQAIIARQLSQPVPSLRIVRDTVPAPLEVAICRALAKVPADRFASAGDFALAVREALADGPSPGRAEPVPGSVDRRPARVSAVAVLPFVNLDADADKEYFSEGITEELIGMLTRIGGLRVASRTSAFAFKDRGLDVREIGQRLNVDVVLEGSVRWAGDALRITAELINVGDGLSIWAGTFERAMREVFSLQEELSQTILNELQLRLSTQGMLLLGRRPAANVEAYNRYLRGRYFWNQRTPEGLKQALRCYEDALTHDPGYAAAHSGLADAYVALSQFQYAPPRDVFPKAEAAARRAIDLDDSLAEAHNTLAHILEVYHWQWGTAEGEYRRALELQPTYATAWAWYGDLLAAVGRSEEALEKMEHARELEPLSMPIAFQHASLLYRMRRYAEAIGEYESIIEMYPQYHLAYLFLGVAYGLVGRYADADSVLERAIAVVGPRSIFQMGLCHVRGLAGREAEARALAGELVERSKREYVPAAFPALAYAGLRDADQAFGWLERAYQDRSLLMALLRIEPLLDPLRDDPRFGEYVQRVFG